MTIVVCVAVLIAGSLLWLTGRRAEVLIAISVGILLGVLLSWSKTARGADHPYYASYAVQIEGSGGSATAIGPQLLVTNRHVAGRAGAVGSARNAEGKRWQIRVIDVSPGADLAMCVTSTAGDDLRWAAIANAEPTSSDTLYGYGYGFGVNSPLSVGNGHLVQYGTGDYRTTLIIQSGDSGCGIFNASGELVAVNHSTPNEYGGRSYAQGTSISVPLPNLRSFVNRVTGGNCGPNGCFPPQQGGGQYQQQYQQQGENHRSPNGPNWLQPAPPPQQPILPGPYAQAPLPTIPPGGPSAPIAPAQPAPQLTPPAVPAPLLPATPPPLDLTPYALKKDLADLESRLSGKIPAAPDLSSLATKDDLAVQATQVADKLATNQQLMDRLKADAAMIPDQIQKAKAAGTSDAVQLAIESVKGVLAQRVAEAGGAIGYGSLVTNGLAVGLGFAGPGALLIWMLTRGVKAGATIIHTNGGPGGAPTQQPFQSQQ